MRNWADDVEAMRQAWPKVDGAWLCCWCGAERKQFWALCNRCWTRKLDANERDLLLSMSLPDRARWILQNKPEPVAPKPSQENLL